MINEPINPNQDYKASGWVLILNNQIFNTFDTADEAYEYMSRNNMKNAFVIAPSKERTVDPKEARTMQRNANKNPFQRN